MFVLSLDEKNEDLFQDDLDISQYKIIKKRWGFKQKIDYLRDEGVLLSHSYELLNLARKIRNKFHEHPLVYRFSNEDMELFDLADAGSANLLFLMQTNNIEEVKQRTLRGCEAASKRFLEKCVKYRIFERAHEVGLFLLLACMT